MFQIKESLKKWLSKKDYFLTLFKLLYIFLIYLKRDGFTLKNIVYIIASLAQQTFVSLGVLTILCIPLYSSRGKKMNEIGKSLAAMIFVFMAFVRTLHFLLYSNEYELMYEEFKGKILEDDYNRDESTEDIEDDRKQNLLENYRIFRKREMHRAKMESFFWLILIFVLTIIATGLPYPQLLFTEPKKILDNSTGNYFIENAVPYEVYHVFGVNTVWGYKLEGLFMYYASTHLSATFVSKYFFEIIHFFKIFGHRK